MLSELVEYDFKSRLRINIYYHLTWPVPILLNISIIVFNQIRSVPFHGRYLIKYSAHFLCKWNEIFSKIISKEWKTRCKFSVGKFQQSEYFHARHSAQGSVQGPWGPDILLVKLSETWQQNKEHRTPDPLLQLYTEKLTINMLMKTRNNWRYLLLKLTTGYWH